MRNDLQTVGRVLDIVRFESMPPEDADQPSIEEREMLIRSLDRVLYAIASESRSSGSVTARRLNRAEYNNTIRDLFGFDIKPADKFPSDEVGGGFDNNGDVLTLSPLLIEKYFDAAEEVAARAIMDPSSLPKLNVDLASDQLFVRGDTKTGSFNGRFLAKGAYVWTEATVPVDGDYSVRLYGGITERDSKPSRFGLFDTNGVLLETYELGYFGSGGESVNQEKRLQLTKGLNRFIIAVIDSDATTKPGETKTAHIKDLTRDVIEKQYADKSKALQPSGEFDTKKYSNLVRRLSIEGPRGSRKDELPRIQQALIPQLPPFDSNKKKWKDVETFAARGLKPFMRRAFRGPVHDEEVKRFANLVRIATDRGDSYYRGMQIAVAGVLMSPRFLYRVESEGVGSDAVDQEKERSLTQHQIATRMSYFLWSSTPDDELLKLADENKLNGKMLDSQVHRMLKDPRADSLATEFASQWLGLRNMRGHSVDPSLFPEYSDSLANAMVEETERFFMHMVRDNRPVSELLTADYTFVDEQLAKFYGVKANSNSGFAKVSLASTPRRGVLSHASVLTLTSNPNRTSPVQRGKWILENILGTAPPEPPPGVPELEQAKIPDPNASFREQLEIHRTDPGCAGCHRVMDQLGFGLESFDAVGRYRESSQTSKIDSSGELPGGRHFSGAADLAKLLAVSERSAFAKTVARRLLTFALGRELTPMDQGFVDAIAKNTEAKDYALADLITEVVQSKPFQFSVWVEEF